MVLKGFWLRCGLALSDGKAFAEAVFLTRQAPGAEGTCLAASGGTGDRYPHSRQAFGEARAAACTCADPGSGRAGPQLRSEASARVQRLEEARRGTYSSSSSSREPLLSRFIDCADQPSWRRAKQACAAAPFAAGLFFNSTTGFLCSSRFTRSLSRRPRPPVPLSRGPGCAAGRAS